MRAANYGDLLDILRQHSLEFERRLAVAPLQLSVPTDGKGARIKVSVKPGQLPNLPKSIEFALRGDIVEVLLEASDDYQDYHPL